MIGKIYISGDIGNCGDTVGVRLLDVISQVKQQPEATEFDVYINSRGGNVYDGLEIYKYLVDLDETHPIKTIGQKKVASIATVLLLSAKPENRFLEKGCAFMIHLPKYKDVSGTSTELQAYLKELKGIEDFLVLFYTENIDLPEDTIRMLLTEETWFKLEQCEALGIAKEYKGLNTLMVARAEFSDNLKFL